MIMSRYQDLRAELFIDKNALDDELVEQPQLFMEVSALLAKAISRRDLAREEQKQIDARLDPEIRSRLGEEKEGRITNAMIEAELEAHPDHIAAREAYKKASAEVAKLEGLQEAFRQRSFMLRELVSLYVANYYDNAPAQASGAHPSDVEHARNRAEMAERRKARRKEREGRERL
jgi:hypothetical protein